MTKGGSGFNWRALPVKQTAKGFEQWMGTELVADARLVSIELSENQFGKQVARWSDGESSSGSSGSSIETWVLLDTKKN